MMSLLPLSNFKKTNFRPFLLPFITQLQIQNLQN